MEDRQELESSKSPQNSMQADLYAFTAEAVRKRLPGCLEHAVGCEEAVFVSEKLLRHLESGEVPDEAELMRLRCEIPFPSKILVVEFDEESEDSSPSGIQEQLSAKIEDILGSSDCGSVRIPTDLQVVTTAFPITAGTKHVCGIILTQKLCQVNSVEHVANEVRCTFELLSDNVQPVELVVTSGAEEVHRKQRDDFDMSADSQSFVISFAPSHGSDDTAEQMQASLYVTTCQPPDGAAQTDATASTERQGDGQDDQATTTVTTARSGFGDLDEHDAWLCLEFSVPAPASEMLAVALDAASVGDASMEQDAYASSAIVGLMLVEASDDVPPHYWDDTVLLGDAAAAPLCKLCVRRAESIRRSPSIHSIYDEDATEQADELDDEPLVDVVTDVLFIADKPGLSPTEVDVSDIPGASVISQDLVPMLFAVNDHSEGVYLAAKHTKAKLSALASRSVGFYKNIHLVGVLQIGRDDDTQQLHDRFPPHIFSPTYLPINLPEGQQPVSWLLMTEFAAPVHLELPDRDDLLVLGTARNSARFADTSSQEGFQSEGFGAMTGRESLDRIVTDVKIIVEESEDMEGSNEGPILRCELSFLEPDMLPLPEQWSPVSRRTESPTPEVNFVASVAIIGDSPSAIAAEGFQIRSPNLAKFLLRQEGAVHDELYFCVTQSSFARAEMFARRAPLFSDIVCVPPGEAIAYETSDYRLLSYDGQLQQGWSVYYRNTKPGSALQQPTSGRPDTASLHPSSSRLGDGVADDELSRITDDSSDESNEFPDAVQTSEAQELAQLQEQVDLLRKQKVALTMTNSDILRKLALLIAKQRGGKEPRHHDEMHSEHQSDLHKEKEKQFHEVLKNITDLKTKMQKQQSGFDDTALSLQVQLDDKEYKATQVASAFKEFRREIAKNAENSRTGRPIPAKLVKQLETAEEKRDDDLEKVRLKHISLRRTLRKHEKALRAKDQLAEGLHMIDFEQLKVENQTLNEKIEERTEELNKLGRKNSVTVQVLTHTKEKLKFVSRQNITLREELADLEAVIATKKTALTKLKRSRDEVRHEVNIVRQKAGFTSSDALMQDFYRRSHTLKGLNQQVKELSDRHSILHETQRENEEIIRTLQATNTGPELTTSTFQSHYNRRAQLRP